eukprot:Clim_evm86s134 gene=Clim_evmTU86s134
MSNFPADDPYGSTGQAGIGTNNSVLHSQQDTNVQATNVLQQSSLEHSQYTTTQAATTQSTHTNTAGVTDPSGTTRSGSSPIGTLPNSIPNMASTTAQLPTGNQYGDMPGTFPQYGETQNTMPMYFGSGQFGSSFYPQSSGFQGNSPSFMSAQSGLNQFNQPALQSISNPYQQMAQPGVFDHSQFQSDPSMLHGYQTTGGAGGAHQRQVDVAASYSMGPQAGSYLDHKQKVFQHVPTMQAPGLHAQQPKPVHKKPRRQKHRSTVAELSPSELAARRYKERYMRQRSRLRAKMRRLVQTLHECEEQRRENISGPQIDSQIHRIRQSMMQLEERMKANAAALERHRREFANAP